MQQQSCRSLKSFTLVAEIRQVIKLDLKESHLPDLSLYSSILAKVSKYQPKITSMEDRNFQSFKARTDKVWNCFESNSRSKWSNKIMVGQLQCSMLQYSTLTSKSRLRWRLTGQKFKNILSKAQPIRGQLFRRYHELSLYLLTAPTISPIWWQKSNR